MLRYCGFLILLCCGLSGWSRADDQPDVLFIAVDDLNDWVQCLGGRAGVHTPNLDRLAAQGTLFTNAHCAAPSCNPSRVAVMTGVAPHQSGIYHNGQSWRAAPRLRNAVTLPEHFRSQGYRAVGGGKIFHALSWIQDAYGKQQNEARLWDAYFPSADRPLPPTLWPKEAQAKTNARGYTQWKPIARTRDPQIPRPAHFWDWAPMDEAESGMADHQVVSWAIDAWQGRKGQPVFQAVGIFRPHIPWFVPKKYFDLYPLEQVKLPTIRENDHDDTSPVGQGFCRRQWHTWAAENDMWRGAVQAYLASISFADAQLGRLLDAVEDDARQRRQTGRQRKTIIVLWSDHGMHIGEKTHWEKFTLWEESTRVPLMVVAPGVTTPGNVCSKPVSLLDIYPTLNQLCGLPQRDDLSGESLVPLLKDPTAKRRTPALTSWGRNNFAVRTERFRYIQYHNGDRELYDHKRDPHEFTNLAAGDAESWEQQLKELAQWIPRETAERVP